MRRKFIAAFAGTAIALAACSEAPEPVAEASEAPEMAEGYAMVPGLYEAGDETTVYGRTRINPDGTYVDLDGETEVGRGTWAAEGANVCFDPEGDGEEQQERCWVNGPIDDDGRITTTRDDGSQSYSVRLIEEN